MPRKPLLSFLLPRSPLQNNDTPSSPASPLPSSHAQNTGPGRTPLSTIQNLKSPAVPPLFTVTIPQMPYPWIWKCHLCGSVYRLGVTRRCLEDGHLFCSLPSPPPSPSPSTTNLSSSFTSLSSLTQKQTKKPKKKRRKQKGCRAEFDYSGWETYNEWRREIRNIKYRCADSLLYPHPQPHPHSNTARLRGARGEGERDDDIWGEKEGRVKTKDCWRDCDFPSECLNERVREREIARQRRIEERGREKEHFTFENENEKEKREEVDGDGDVAMPDSPTLDGPDMSFYSTEDENTDVDVDVECDGQCSGHDGHAGVKEEENLGPVGTDSDGLGEEKLELPVCRRKSLESGMETPPSSPLKESFGFADVEAGVWGCEGERMEQILL